MSPAAVLSSRSVVGRPLAPFAAARSSSCSRRSATNTPRALASAPTVIAVAFRSSSSPASASSRVVSSRHHLARAPLLRTSTSLAAIADSMATPADAATPLAAPPHAMTDMERYLFDLNGFLVVRGVFSPEEVAAANAAIDRKSENIVERTGDLRLGGKKGDALAGDGVTGRADLGGMLGWEAPDRDVFRSVLAHPKLVPYYHAMMGEGYRMDHLPLLIQQAPGADGFVFHGGKMNDDGSWCEELAYQWHGGKMYNRLLAVSVALTETKPGDGGFCIIRGSHKSNMPCPAAIQRYEQYQELVDNPGLKPGDVVFFTEAATHGTLPWSAQHTRRACLYRFAPATSSYGRAYLPTWPAGMNDGLTPAEAAVLEAPYHPRLDRPALTLSGEVAGQRRAEWKKDHDNKVFGSKYF